jgi:single-strand DNA-binding protein
MNETTTTIVGNLVEDPTLRFTPTGRAVANVRIASTPRYQSANEWKDGTTLFLTCTVWGQQAENVAESLLRGHRVIARGRLKQREFQTREGERRTVVELDIEDIGPGLSNATAKITKAARSGPSAPVSQAPAQPAANPWDQPVQQGGSPDPWTSPAVPVGAGAVTPPF